MPQLDSGSSIGSGDSLAGAFSGGGGGGEGTLVGSIYAKVGAIFDPRGFTEQEAAAKKAKEIADKPIVAHGGMKHDPSGFKLFSHDVTKATHETATFREHIGKLSFGLSGLANGMAGLAAGFGVFELLKKGIDRMGELESTSARTTAELKATSDASKETKKGIEALADSIFRKTGIDHEQVQAGENVLLNYKNIRNEVGQHADIYTQATKAAANLSAALPGKDMASAAKMVGVALNDPAVGLTRLSRAGIVFSAQQKELIKTMLEEGKLFDAQRYILGELEKRYGGVADKIGNTTPAALARAKVGFEDVAATIAAKASPAIKDVGNFLSKLSEQLQDNTGFGHVLIEGWNAIETAGGRLVSMGKKVIGIFSETSTKGEILRSALLGLAGGFAAFKIVSAVTSAVQLFAKAIELVALAVEANPLGLLLVAVAAIGVAVIAASTHFKNFGQYMDEVWAKIRHVVGEGVAVVKEFLQKNKQDIAAWGEAFKHAGEAIVWVFKNLILPMAKKYLGGVIDEFEGLVEVIKGIVNIIAAIFNGEWSRAWKGLKEIVGGSTKAIIGFALTMTAPIRFVAEKVADAVENVMGGAWNFLEKLVAKAISAILGAISNYISGLSKMVSIAEEVVGTIDGGLDKKLKHAAEGIDNYRKHLVEGDAQAKKTEGIEKLQRETDAFAGKLDTLKKGSKEYQQVADELKVKHEALNKILAASKGSANEASEGLENLSGTATNMAKSTDSNVAAMGKELNEALKAMGVPAVSFPTSASTQAMAEAHTKHARAATGGWLGARGQVGPDNKLILAADGEGVLNRHQVPAVDMAMAIAHKVTGGAFPYSNLDHLFASIKTPHFAAGGMIPGFASGGMTRLQAMEKEADRINALHLAYELGGGHGSTPAPSNGPFDCSSAVSRVVQMGGYKIPTDTTPALLEDWHFPTGAGQATIYAKGGAEAHTILKLGQRFWGTSGFGHPGWTGPGWFTVTPPQSYLSQFQEVHPPDLGGTADTSTVKLRKPVVKGPEGLFRRVAQTASNAAWRGAQAYAARAQPAATGGGNADIAGLPPGIKQLIGASTFGGPSDPGTGHIGYRGVDLSKHPDSFAELSRNPSSRDFSALGNLAAGTRLWFGYHGKRMVLAKNDVGAGGGPVKGKPRDADIWWQAASALGFPEPGLDTVEVERAAKGLNPHGHAATVKAKARSKGKVDKGHKYNLPSWITGEKAVKQKLSSLNRVEQTIKDEGERYNDLVSEYNRTNARTNNVVPKTTYDSQTGNLVAIKRNVRSDYESEKSVAKETATALADAGGPHSPAAKRLHALGGSVTHDEGLLEKLKATARGVKDAARRAASAQRKTQLSSHIKELRAENGKRTPGKAPEPERFDALGNKIPAKAGSAPGKPKDNSKAIHSAEQELQRINSTADAKDKQAREAEAIKALEERIKKEKKREAELKKKVDAFTKLQEQLGSHQEAADSGAHSTDEEIKDTENTQVVTDESDVKAEAEAQAASYDELTPQEQQEQEVLELHLSEAAAESPNSEAQAAAEIKPAEDLLAFARNVLAYRQGITGGDPSKPGAAKGLKDAEDMVAAAQQQLTQLTEGTAGGKESADAQAQVQQLETKASDLELLNRTAQANLTAFSGPGDIGSGYGGSFTRNGAFAAAANPGEYGATGASPYSAGVPAPSPFPVGHPLAGVALAPGQPVILQTFQSLHVATPAARAQVASATVDALNGQNFIRSSKEAVL